MIEHLIEWSARNRFFVFLLTAIAIGAGLYGLYHTPLDAIPDLSDVQVIVLYQLGGALTRPGRGPGHLSYLHALHRRTPGQSRCAANRCSAKSFVYVIFQDGTDIYWARSRVLEYLNSVRGLAARRA